MLSKRNFDQLDIDMCIMLQKMNMCANTPLRLVVSYNTVCQMCVTIEGEQQLFSEDLDFHISKYI